VLISDQNYLVGQTSRMAKQKRILRYAIIGLSTLFLGLFILGVSQDFVSSQIQLGDVSESVENINDIDWNSAPLQTFTKTNELREIIEQISTEEEESGIFDWGMNRGADVLEPARKLYFSKTESFQKKYLIWSVGKQA
jgi:hypothetical protein